jgi:hypothetical protein
LRHAREGLSQSVDNAAAEINGTPRQIERHFVGINQARLNVVFLH